MNQPFDTRVLEDAGRRTAPTGCARASTAGRSMARPSYEAQLEAGCERFRACRYDGGAFGRVVDKPEYITADLHHFSVQGHGKAAAVAWAAMKRVGLVPRSRMHPGKADR